MCHTCCSYGLSFYFGITVDIATLVTCIAAQVIGAYIGPRFVVKLSPKTIRSFISVGLIIATLFIMAGKFNLIPSGGTATGLSGIKLIIAAVCLCVFGALKQHWGWFLFFNDGNYLHARYESSDSVPHYDGSFRIFSYPIGSMEFIKYGQYSRKITLFYLYLWNAGCLVGFT